MAEFGLETGFKLVPAIILATILILFIVVGLMSRVKSVDEYWVAGRGIGPIANGAAVASNWMSAASFLGMAGVVYLQGYGYMSYVVGWTGGYTVLSLLMASQIRRYGKFTATDFVGDRYYSQVARTIAAVVTILIAFTYSVAQYKGIGMVFEWIFGLSYNGSVVLGAGVVIIYVMIAGMLGVSRNQVVQYVILIIAFLLPLFFIANQLDYFAVIPQLGYGSAVWEIGHAADASYYDPTYAAPFATRSAFNFIAITFTMMMGTMGLPHVMARFYTTPNERDARWSVAWGLFFISLLYWSSPVYASFARVLQEGAMPASDVADVIVVSSASMAGLPEWFVGFLAAGAIAAAFSTTSGLLTSGAAAVSHDLYFRVFKPSASHEERLWAGRIGTVVLGILIIFVALNPPALIAQIVGAAFALAGNTFFPLMIIGIWWGRASKEGGVAGMLVGLGIWLFSVWGDYWADIGWVQSWIPASASSLIAVPIVFIVVIVVSLMTPPPPREIRALLREVHGGEREVEA